MDVDRSNKTVVFYDGGCGLCSKEINHYRRCDRNMQIDWVDIQAGSEWLKQLGIRHVGIRCRHSHHKVDQGTVMRKILRIHRRFYPVYCAARYIGRCQ